jgi:tetratricopeptide (TPR) repeat protein
MNMILKRLPWALIAVLLMALFSDSLFRKLAFNLAYLNISKQIDLQPWLGQLLPMDQGDPEYAMVNGLSALQQGKPGAAETYFRVAARGRKKELAYYYLSAIAAEKGNLAEQLKYTALASESLLGRTASQLVAREQWGVILSSFGQVIEAVPESAVANRTYGLALLRGRKDYTAAADYLERALVLQPDDRDIYVMLAEVSREQGDYTRAWNWLSIARQRYPYWEQVFIEIAQWHRSRGDLNAAIQTLRDYLSTQPNCGVCHFWIGSFLADQGLAGEALEQYRLAAAMMPKDVWSAGAYLKWAQAEEAAGNLAEAITAYRIVLQLNPSDQTALEALERLEH